MTRQDDGKDLLALWQDAVSDTDDPMRRLAEVMLQRLLEEEISAHLNAEPNERTDGRQGLPKRPLQTHSDHQGGQGGTSGSA
jgi:transposase-like protein